MRTAMPATGRLVMPGCVIASSQPAPPSPAASGTRAVLERFIDLMVRRGQVRAAFECCVVREGFVDHAGFGSRAAAMSSVANDLRPACSRVELLHLVCEGDMGMVHLRLHAAEGAAPAHRVEIFRVAEDRIVEHWSVAA